MKRILTFACLFLMSAVPCYGAGAESSVSEIETQTMSRLDRKIVTIQWEANASSGVSWYNCTSVGGEILEKVVVDPGATAPTADYDIELNDAYLDYELSGGVLIDRSATTTEEIPLCRTQDIIAYDELGPTVIGKSGVSILIYNNAVANAVGKVHLFLKYR